MIHFQPAYLALVGLSVTLALLFPVTRHIKSNTQRAQYYRLQLITLIGAVVGAKLSVLFGDWHWPWRPLADPGLILNSGRSITGALLLGFLSAECAKPLLGYRMPPNDRFAALLPFTIGIGRVGCLLAGCCNGLPHEGWCSIQGADGIARFPAQIVEIIFQAAVGLGFVLAVRRGWWFGRLFSLYLILYGLFRFATEFYRDTPKFYGGYSGYQILSLAMIAVGVGFLLKRTLQPPPAWEEFRARPAKANSTTRAAPAETQTA